MTFELDTVDDLLIYHVGSVETRIFLVGQTEVVFPLIDILT